jgi:hypothetical protein
MKKLIFTLTFFAIVAYSCNFVQGQSQRLVLLEHFTQASCGYCPPWNTAYEALKAANPGKFVIIRHQVSWPGVDPMNAENPSDPAARVSYYSITGVPASKTDGTITGQLLQAALNTEYAVPSPFDMSVTHTISSDYDSIFIQVIITCTQAVTGALVLQTVIEENHIHYATQPGNNGETDFYNVLRKMLPSPSGTTLATSWTVGQTQTLNFAVPLPTYIHNVNEVRVVAYIQNNTGKSVKQAGADDPIIQSGDANLDAGISAITNVPVLSCTGDITPSVTLKNYGTTALTSATINYQIDNGTLQTQAWSGSLAANATSIVTLPLITVPSGGHTFTASVSNPNGSADLYLINNQMTKPVNVTTTTVTTPVVEGFQTSVPPTNWILYNPGSDGTWIQSTPGGFGASTKSAKIPFFSIASGTDELYLPAIDMSSDTNSSLTFSVAYAQYSTSYVDQLKVYVSINCGSTWTIKYSKSGATLATAPLTTSSFTPTAAQWRTDTINLDTYIGEPQVNVKFTGVSGYGNNLYIDDINLTQTTTVGIHENISSENLVNIYPNPFSGNAVIDLDLNEQSTVGINIYNTLGELVYSEKPGTFGAGNYKFQLDGNDLPASIYYVNILINNDLVTRKISIVK